MTYDLRLTTYLSDIAGHIIAKHKQSLDNLTILLPNKRSCLFLQRELAQRISDTTWAPKIVSLQDWVISQSPVKPVEEIVAIFKLYESYCNLYPNSHENFDSFYYEGQILLNDFNDIDAELADAQKLFLNLANLKAISNEFNQNDEFLHILNRFSEVFAQKTTSTGNSPKNSIEAYIGIWQKLLPLYNSFRSLLISESIAYDGLLFRNFVETILPQLNFNTDTPFYVIGFNALSKSELEIFDHLKKSYSTSFFWDYDEFYVSETTNKAGFYLKDLLKRFPIPSDFSSNVDAIKNKSIDIYALPNELAQTKFLTSLLENKCNADTAIVLSDENLLNAVMASLPAQNEGVNITMGYSIRNTSVYALIKLIFALQNHIKKSKEHYYVSKRQLIDIFYHPYFSHLDWSKQLLSHFLEQKDHKQSVGKGDMISLEELNALLEQIKVPEPVTAILNPSSADDYLNKLIALLQLSESYLLSSAQVIPLIQIEIQVVRKLYNALSNFKSLISLHKIAIQRINILQRLLMQVINRVKIHFHGEPLEGLQIMGLMESRLLDFKNIIILSANDGILPSDSFSSSFILYALREYFGLSTSSRRESIDAYHFYRLLQRSENVTIMYARFLDNDEADKSPFVRQLIYNEHINTNEHILTDQLIKSDLLQQAIVVDKKNVAGELDAYINYVKQHGLSHHAISLYLQCPLHFYFANVKRLKPENLYPDEFSNTELGLLFHEVIEELFNGFQEVDEAVLNKIASNVDAVTEKVIKTFYKEEIGIVLLLKTQVKLYVQKFLDVEKKRVPYSISSTENELDTFIKINELNIKLYGRPDRIIHQHGTYFIQDFKTGKEYKTKTDNLEDVFASDIQMKYLFQLLFYGYLFNKKKPDTLLNGELIYIKKYSEPLKNMLQMEKKTINISAITEPFETILVQKCKEIFSTDIPFSQTLDIKNCEYCDFNIICRKF
jgi:hypothetical protein